MAISTSSNYYSNAIVGQPMVGADINVYDRNSTPKYAVGFGFIRADGNCFRYVQYGAAVAAGTLVGNGATNTNLQSTNALVVAPATAQAIANEIITAGSAGSRYVEIILATVANNQFAGGYLVTTKDTGWGYTYRIRGNTATNTPTTGNFRCELYEPIKVALDNTTDIAIAAPKYGNAYNVVPIEGSTSNYVGVVMSAASNSDYGWVCTKGFVGCLTSATNVGQGNVAAASLMSGAYIQLQTLTSLAFQRLGTVIVPGVASQLGIINLDLE